MNWKIAWNSNALDEIRLVYEKAEGNTGTTQLLAELEDGALAEIRNCKDFCRVDGKELTPEEVDALPDGTKERLIVALANAGLEELSLNKGNPTHLVARLSPRIQSVLHCTAFSLLNRMEKLDGALNVLFPNVTLEIQAPLGGKRGLLSIEMLISMLYPWLSVQETSTNVAAVSPSNTPPRAAGATPKTVKPARTTTPRTATTSRSGRNAQERDPTDVLALKIAGGILLVIILLVCLFGN